MNVGVCVKRRLKLKDQTRSKGVEKNNPCKKQSEGLKGLSRKGGEKRSSGGYGLKKVVIYCY